MRPVWSVDRDDPRSQRGEKVVAQVSRIGWGLNREERHHERLKNERPLRWPASIDGGLAYARSLCHLVNGEFCEPVLFQQTPGGLENRPFGHLAGGDLARAKAKSRDLVHDVTIHTINDNVRIVF